MNVSEIKNGKRNIDMEGVLIGKGEVRTVNLNSGEQKQVCTFKLGDNSGEINLSLWEDQINLFSVGDRVKIGNGYATSFNEVVQLNVGKYGTIEKV